MAVDYLQHAGTEATGSWWYNMFYTRTAAMVIIFANLSPLVRAMVGLGPLNASYTKCEEILMSKLPQDRTVRMCLETLKNLRNQVHRFISQSVPQQVDSSHVPCGDPDVSFAANDFAFDVSPSAFDNFFGDGGTFTFAMDDYGTSLL